MLGKAFVLSCTGGLPGWPDAESPRGTGPKKSPGHHQWARPA